VRWRTICRTEAQTNNALLCDRALEPALRSCEHLIHTARDVVGVIVGVANQELTRRAVARSINRCKAHMGPSDRAINAMRQLLLQAIRTVREGGDPPGVADSYSNGRGWRRLG
jgi:hypothetical protein